MRWLGHVMLPGLLNTEYGFFLRQTGSGTLMIQDGHRRGVAFWLLDTSDLRARIDQVNAALKARGVVACRRRRAPVTLLRPCRVRPLSAGRAGLSAC